MIPIHWIAGIALVTACTMSEEKFEEELTQTWCERGDECDLAEWDFDFDSKEDCIEQLEGGFEEEYGDCEYDAQKAEDCLDALDAAACDDLYRTVGDDCSDVWDCGEGYDTSY